ncbi:glycosyltransferase family 87 protein [Sphingomonas sp. TX0543]|uniref:glycosyltransferase family 87 protein n=1 Tax=unclassified Sphingomonas TaxID=196159 RepID=UPI0010F4494E|nr:glycosyltransferase family 87 protein [Sphingomonas sp. 3P27F8]
MHSRLIDRHRLLVLLIVAIAARAATFGNPVVHVDEDFYFTVAQAMWRGAIPYIDIWDRKPAGLFLLYMPPAALPFWWGIWTYQAMALASVVATAGFIARLAIRAGWRDGATLAGAAYILWLNVAQGQGGQSPVFYNLPMAAAALLIASNGARLWRRDAAAMLLVGIALTIKTSAVFEGVFFGLWIVARDWRGRIGMARVASRAVMLAMLALAPTAAIALFYATIGAFDAFLYANVWSIFSRADDPAMERWGNLAQLVLFLSPLIAMAFSSHGVAEAGDAASRRFVRCWFAVALMGILLFGGWYEHYALPAMVPGTICAAGFLGRRRGAGLTILVLVALVGTVNVVMQRIGRGGPAEFAALTQAVGPGPGCLWVYSGDTKLYAATARCHPSRYMFPSHLYRLREQRAVGVDQAREVRRILSLRPTTVVMRPASRGERQDIRAIVTAAMTREYRLVHAMPLGDETISVYELKR